MSTSTPTRVLSLHERYAVARRCINSPPTVSAAAVLHLDTLTGTGNQDQALETLQRHLERRIVQALAQYPLLGYCVQGPRSKAPRWAPVTPTSTSKDILHIGTATLKQQGAETDKLLSQAILNDHLTLPKTTDLEKGPLWKVSLSQIEVEAGEFPKCLVVLSTDHVINDGRGTLNLLRFLLQSQEPLTPGAGGSIPPASDKIFNFRPSAGYLLGQVWKELILPRLPMSSKLKAKLRGPISWPASPSSSAKKRKSATSSTSEYDIVRQPSSCSPALDILLISAPRLITNLKLLARSHIDPHSSSKKAATLHSIIHTLAIVSLFSAIAHSHSIPSSALEGYSVVMGTATPISLRDEARPVKRRRGLPLSPSVEPSPIALPLTSGNYVSSYADNYTLTGREGFWRFTNRFASDLASPRGRKLAKQHMGLLAYIPDFEQTPMRGKRKLDDEEEVDSSLGGVQGWANGWEKHFGTQQESETPFDSAFTISNLGLLDLPSLGVGDWRVGMATWAQSHTPQGEAFGLDVMGFVGEEQETVSVGVSSRPTAFGDEGLHKRFKGYLERLVRAFASETGGGGKTSQRSSVDGTRLDLSKEVTFATLAKFLAEP